MKATKLIINWEAQAIAWWDGINRTLYVDYDGITSHWVLVSNEFVTTTINDIQNNVVLIFRWNWGDFIPDRIYDSNWDYVDIALASLSDYWNGIDSNGVLLGIIKKEIAYAFTFYPRYWGTHISS